MSDEVYAVHVVRDVIVTNNKDGSNNRFSCEADSIWDVHDAAYGLDNGIFEYCLEFPDAMDDKLTVATATLNDSKPCLAADEKTEFINVQPGVYVFRNGITTLQGADAAGAYEESAIFIFTSGVFDPGEVMEALKASDLVKIEPRFA